MLEAATSLAQSGASTGPSAVTGAPFEGVHIARPVRSANPLVYGTSRAHEGVPQRADRSVAEVATERGPHDTSRLPRNGSSATVAVVPPPRIWVTSGRSECRLRAGRDLDGRRDYRVHLSQRSGHGRVRHRVGVGRHSDSSSAMSGMGWFPAPGPVVRPVGGSDMGALERHIGWSVPTSMLSAPTRCRGSRQPDGQRRRASVSIGQTIGPSRGTRRWSSTWNPA
jgi:hypothetical protein